jgi:hypothetical protein
MQRSCRKKAEGGRGEKEPRNGTRREGFMKWCINKKEDRYEKRVKKKMG